MKWRDGVRPDNTVVIVVLFDGGGDDTRHADAIAAHRHGNKAAVLTLAGGLHGLAVPGAELEDVAHLDTAADAECARAVLATGLRCRARVSGQDVAQVSDRGLGQVAAPVHALEVLVVAIGAAHEVAEARGALVGDDGDLESHRADGAGFAAGFQFHLARGDERQGLRHLWNFFRLDGVECVVTAQDQGDHTAHAFHQQGLDCLLGIDLEEATDVFDAVLARCVHAGHRR